MREQYKTYIEIYNEAAQLNKYEGERFKNFDFYIKFS